MGTERTVIYLFPDTNLFIQCRPLTELKWILWKEYDEVRVIVTRPVQREVDGQKSKSTGRVNKRARSTASLFKEIITGPDGYKLVRDQRPRVTLVISPEYLPDPSLAEELDYDERDDQLVGTVSAFIKRNPNTAARLLTHDSGPLASAKMVRVPFTPIPDDWLLQPESTKSEKAISSLENQIARLTAAEPRFTILCFDAHGEPAEKLDFDIKQYEPLSDNEFATLMSDIRTTFPLETDFGSHEPAEREYPQQGAFRMPGLKLVYEPANQDDITAYCEKLYPLWLEACEDRLRTLHAVMQEREGAPAFRFVARNEGTRPARDALITIEALGRFQIIPPSRDGDDDDASGRRWTPTTALPSPPKAPKGQWLKSIGDTARHFAKLQRNLAHSAMGLDQSVFASRRPNIGSFAALDSPRRDPNAFYYKPSRPTRTASSFSLECDQWRHAVDPESFWGEIHLPSDETSVFGALECRIHADNLSEIVSARVPVRISVQIVSVFGQAEQLIRDFRSAHAA